MISHHKLTFKSLISISRPLLWPNTAMLWIIGLLALGKPPTWEDGMMIIYFTFPFNLWLHGINDVYDFESDQLNPRKGGIEGALVAQEAHQALLWRVWLWNLPFWGMALGWGNKTAVGLLTLYLFLGWAYSAPPLRGKSRPFVDSLINAAYLLPYPIVLAWHNAPTPLWQASSAAMLAFTLWSIASHAFTSIQDMEADQKGGIATIATFLGRRFTAWVALLLYLLAMLLVSFYGWEWSALVAGYPLLVLWYLVAPTQAKARLFYRGFMGLNFTVGFVLTVALALANRANTVWAALLVCGLMGVIVVAQTASLR